MKSIAIVIHSNIAETVWNAVRLANYARKEGDIVSIFLLAQGVEIEKLSSDKFPITEQLHAFLTDGGKILACGTCLKLRQQEESELCPLSKMADLYDLVNKSDKILTF